MRLVEFVAEALELVVVITPILVHLDVEFQEHLLAEEGLKVVACCLPHLLKALTLVANDDSLLLGACHIDGGRYAVDGRLLLVCLDGNLA